MKRFSIGLILVMVLGAVFASNALANPTQITYWTFFSGGDAEYMSDLIEQFNSEQNDIVIQEEVLPWGEYYTRLTAAIAGGNAPDIGIFHVSHLPSFVGRNVFVALDDYFADVDFPAEDFNPTAWEAGQVDGQQYAIPIDTHPEVFYYNIDIFEAAGWMNEDGTARIPQTADEMIEFGHAVKAVDDDLVPFAMDTAPGGAYRIWLGLMAQAGGSLMDADGNLAFNGPEGLQALQFLYDVVVENGFSEVGTSAQLLFREQDAAVQIGGVWNTGVHEQQEGLNFGATMVPPIFGQNANWANSHAIIVPRQRAGEDSATISASLEFLDWLTANGAHWARAGHIPPRMSVLDSAEFQNLPYRPEYARAAEFAVFLPQTTSPAELENVINEYIEAMYHGQFGVQQTLDRIEAELQNVLR